MKIKRVYIVSKKPFALPPFKNRLKLVDNRYIQIFDSFGIYDVLTTMSVFYGDKPNEIDIGFLIIEGKFHQPLNGLFRR